MKYRYSDLAREGAMLVLLALGLACFTCSRADDESKPAGVVVAAPAPEQVVRLPSLKVGGIRSGHVMLITDRGMEFVPPAVLAQGQSMSKPSPFPPPRFCNPN